MRDTSKEAELGGVEGIILLPLDVTKPEQIAEAARLALARGPVDVVFNNAGYGLAGPFEEAYAQRLVLGIDQFRKAITQRFMG